MQWYQKAADPVAAAVAEPCCSGHPPASAPGPGLFFKAAHQAPSLALGIALCPTTDQPPHTKPHAPKGPPFPK